MIAESSFAKELIKSANVTATLSLTKLTTFKRGWDIKLISVAANKSIGPTGEKKKRLGRSGLHLPPNWTAKIEKWSPPPPFCPPKGSD
jgi:hypothetical protein